MKKIINFIIEKRYYILAFMLVLCIICGFLIPGVTVNRDMTKYLPDDSSMKKGIEIMKTEFPETPTDGSIRVMFKDLGKERVPEVLDKLREIPDINGVDYDDSEKYNKEPYTLFTVRTNYNYKEDKEIAIEKAIKEQFRAEKPTVQHVMETITTIPGWILATVMVLLIIILFIMCPSWTEPFLFLFTIGAAVVLNMGTNSFLSSVSETTFSLSAVLQLALSMDYSIILMNRYRQEKQKTESKTEAMKNAYRAALPSIISSGMTTVIGLLMLLFMSFKIGMDLGTVMAKGVAFSMLCVLTILPALILLCDRLIDRTQKKKLHIRTDGIAKFSFRSRKVMAFVFAALFIGTAILQTFTTITFGQLKNDDIEKVFPSPNPIVVLYNNEDEEKAAQFAETIQNNDKVGSVLGYVNTVGKQMTAEEMSAMINAAGGQTPVIPTEAVKLIYYDFHGGKPLDTMTLEQFLLFVTDTVADNKMFSGYVDAQLLGTLQAAKPFINKEFILTPVTQENMIKLTGMNKEKIQPLYMLYFANDESFAPSPMTINDFLKFLKEQSAGASPVFPSDEATTAQINALLPLTDKNTVTAPLPSGTIASVLNLDPAVTDGIFMLKYGTSEKKTMSVSEFINFVVTDIVAKPEYAAMIKPEQLAYLKTLKVLTDAAVAGTEFTHEQMAQIFSFDAGMTKMLFILRMQTQEPDALKISPCAFVDFIADKVASSPLPGQSIDKENLLKLKVLQSVMNAIKEETGFSAKELAAFLSTIAPETDGNITEIVYLLCASAKNYDSGWTLAPAQMLGHLTDGIADNTLISSMLDDKTKAQIQALSEQFSEGVKNLRGPEHSILLLTTSLEPESEQTTEFIGSLKSELDTVMTHDYYLVGNSPMNVEMEQGFGKDLILITILTAVAIFIVVALTFRSAFIPLMLVLIVQCGVFITVTFNGMIGNSIYYLALLVVQCILMGATVDYGIVFTNYYTENRRSMGIADALTESYRKSIHTILTSGLIIILVTGVIGFSPADPSITQICLTLSLGTLAAVLLIMFVLPGLLAAFDKLVIRKKKSGKLKK